MGLNQTKKVIGVNSVYTGHAQDHLAQITQFKCGISTVSDILKEKERWMAIQDGIAALYRVQRVMELKYIES
jgi:hypothetical protein